MFGLKFFDEVECRAWKGWRTIFTPHAGYPVDVVPGRSSREGTEEDLATLTGWLDGKNSQLKDPEDKRKRCTPWLWLQHLSRRLSPSDLSYIEFSEHNLLLRATPNASYGYLYIDAGIVSDWKDYTPRETPGIVLVDANGNLIDTGAAAGTVSVS